MSTTDREFVRGWFAAQRGDPLDPYQTPAWTDGYRDWFEAMRRKWIVKALARAL